MALTSSVAAEENSLVEDLAEDLVEDDCESIWSRLPRFIAA